MYRTHDDLRSKIVWEGGIEAFLAWGGDSSVIPNDPELQFAWSRMLGRWREFRDAAEDVEEILGIGWDEE